MNLTPREKDKLLISMAAIVARRRRRNRRLLVCEERADADVGNAATDQPRAGYQGSDALEQQRVCPRKFRAAGAP